MVSGDVSFPPIADIPGIGSFPPIPAISPNCLLSGRQHFVDNGQFKIS
jgi:hypothetical protein